MDVSRISEEILETVRRYRNEPDAQGMPAMKYHDQMLGCQRKLDDAFTQVKHFMAQQQRQMEDHHSMKARGGKGEGYGDDEHWGMDKDQNFNGPDQKKIRRGVSYIHYDWQKDYTDRSSREPHHQDVATAATAPRHQSGDVDQTEPEPFATHVVFTTPS